MTMKWSKGIFVLFLVFFVSSLSYSKEKENEGEVTTEGESLRQSYHRLESRYGLARVQPVHSSEKEMLHNFWISGEFVLSPEVSLTGRLPFVTLGSQLALTNPSLGLKGSLFEGLLKGFPAFVFLEGSIKPPLASQKEFVFKRTDVFLGVSSLREVYHLSLGSDLSYTLKLDPSSALENYGNELAASIYGELNTGYQFSLGLNLNYRRAGDLEMKDQEKTLSGRSVFIMKPYFSYHYTPDVTFQGTLAMPLAQRLSEALRVFGDYTIPGIGGNTFYLTFERKF